MNIPPHTRTWFIFGIAVLITGMVLLAVFGFVGSASAPAAQPSEAQVPILIPTVPVPDIPTATVSLSATLSPDVLGQPLPTSVVPDSGEPLPPVIFVREGNLWRGGQPPQRLTNFGDDTTVMYPVVSPDGTQLAFVALTQPPISETVPLPIARVYLMNLDGSDLRVAWEPENGLIQIPAWHPDGQQLYITWNGAMVAPGATEIERVTQVLLLHVQDGTVTPVLDNAMDPAVTRGGDRLAFLQLQDDGVSMDLAVADLDGNNPQILVPGMAFPAMYAPRFTPDGQRILFAAIGGPETDPEGKPRESNIPRESAVATHGIPWDIWSVGVDGTGLRRLTFFYEDLPMIAFAPDGAQVAIMGYGGIYLMNPDGSLLRRLDSQGDHGGLDWPRSATGN